MIDKCPVTWPAGVVATGEFTVSVAWPAGVVGNGVMQLCLTWPARLQMLSPQCAPIRQTVFFMFEFLCIITLVYIKNQQDATLAVLFISNCKITLHVSDAFCVHHQE